MFFKPGIAQKPYKCPRSPWRIQQNAVKSPGCDQVRRRITQRHCRSRMVDSGAKYGEPFCFEQCFQIACECTARGMKQNAVIRRHAVCDKLGKGVYITICRVDIAIAKFARGCRAGAANRIDGDAPVSGKTCQRADACRTCNQNAANAFQIQRQIKIVDGKQRLDNRLMTARAQGFGKRQRVGFGAGDQQAHRAVPSGRGIARCCNASDFGVVRGMLSMLRNRLSDSGVKESLPAFPAQFLTRVAAKHSSHLRRACTHSLQRFTAIGADDLSTE